MIFTFKHGFETALYTLLISNNEAVLAHSRGNDQYPYLEKLNFLDIFS